MEDVRVVDVWFEGQKYEVPQGEASGKGLRLYFSVPNDEDLFVLDSTSKIKTLVHPDGKYFVTQWDHFHKISHGRVVVPTDKPQVYHIKSAAVVGKNAIYVGRPTKWGNPYKLKREEDRQEVIDKYRQYMKGNPALVMEAKQILKSRNLSCWCAPKACHADVLLEIANEE